MSQRDPGVYLEDIEHYAGLAISITWITRRSTTARLFMRRRCWAPYKKR